MKTDMKGLFVVIKGQYRKCGEVFFNDVSNERNYLGGYDPESEYTVNWYMLVDTETYTTLASGVNLEKVVSCARKYIKKYKTRKAFLQSLSDMEYGNTTSPIHRRLMQEVCKKYGSYYQDLIEETVDDEYTILKDSMINPLLKGAKKRLKRLVTPDAETPVKKENTPPHKSLVLGKLKKVKPLGFHTLLIE